MTTLQKGSIYKHERYGLIEYQRIDTFANQRNFDFRQVSTGRSKLLSADEVEGMLSQQETVESVKKQLDDLLAKIRTEFPIFQEEGLDEEEHHCEWTLLQERKRLHMVVFGKLPQLCGGCGTSWGGKCPDCGPVMGDATYQSMFRDGGGAA